MDRVRRITPRRPQRGQKRVTIMGSFRIRGSTTTMSHVGAHQQGSKDACRVVDAAPIAAIDLTHCDVYQITPSISAIC
jgi:hypothetical protein